VHLVLNFDFQNCEVSDESVHCIQIAWNTPCSGYIRFQVPLIPPTPNSVTSYSMYPLFHTSYSVTPCSFPCWNWMLCVTDWLKIPIPSYVGTYLFSNCWVLSWLEGVRLICTSRSTPKSHATSLSVDEANSVLDSFS